MKTIFPLPITMQTIDYLETEDRLPQNGQHILAYQEDNALIVYQAYNNAIADYAVKNQAFGGSHYRYNRMSWIKPNFLWMVYRCGWASKENQERVLAIKILKTTFAQILSQAVSSSYDSARYESHEKWKDDLNKKEARLQWDPDHEPFGRKLTRGAIQIGMKGAVLEKFGKHDVLSIEDVTAFVKEQKQAVDENNLESLRVPVETIYRPSDEALCKSLGID